MINFLKKIRHTSIKENKTSKYLVYAFGEVTLVVIGILIALAVNNWNSKQIENERAELFIKNLKTQIEKNLLVLDGYVEENTYYYSKSKYYLGITGSKDKAKIKPYLDSLVMFNILDFHLNIDMNTVVEGRENGSLALLSSDYIRKSIYYLITLEKDIKERERITNSYLNNQFLPYLNKNYNIRNLISTMSPDDNLGRSKIYKGDNNNIILDQEFENLITTRIFNGIELLDLYIELKKVLESIHKML